MGVMLQSMILLESLPGGQPVVEMWSVCLWHWIRSWGFNFRWGCPPESYPESYLGGCGSQLVLVSPISPGSLSSVFSNCVLFCRRWWRNRSRWGRKYVHWRREREPGAQETSLSIERLVPLFDWSQHCLPVANSGKSRSQELLKKVFDEVMLCSKLVFFEGLAS